MGVFELDVRFKWPVAFLGCAIAQETDPMTYL